MGIANNTADSIDSYFTDQEFAAAILAFKEDAILNNWSNLSAVHKKAIFHLSLTEDEKQTIIDWYRSQ